MPSALGTENADVFGTDDYIVLRGIAVTGSAHAVLYLQGTIYL